MIGVASEANEPLRCCPTCRAIFRRDFVRCPQDGSAVHAVDRDPLLGATIGAYVVDAFLGEGGMARVYRAHHTRLARRHVALKLMLGDLSATATNRLRFAREAEAASRLAHPNVVPVVDFGQTSEGLLYLAMELVEGPTLGALIRDQGPLTLARTLALARQLCHGLAHAHALGLVHRDFKPDNVLLCGELARIVDFGLAISVDPDDLDVARVTSASIVLGTPVYAAPEQLAGGLVDHRADLFALGVTLYEMVAGRLPFEGTMLQVAQLNATAAPPPIALRSPGVVIPPRLERAIHRLMARRPSHRFGSARELLPELDRIEIDALAPPLPEVCEPLVWADRETLPRRVRRRPLRTLVATALVGAAAVAAFTVRPWRAVEVARLEVPPATPVPPPEVPVVEEESPLPAAQPLVAAVVDAGAPRRWRTPRARQVAIVRDEAPAAIDAAPVIELPPPPPTLALAPPPSPRPLPPALAPPPEVHLRVEALAVRGPLGEAAIRRGLDRVRPTLFACHRRASWPGPALRLRVRFTIGETRRADHVTVSTAPDELARCVGAAIAGVRVVTTPDVGDVRVDLDLAYVQAPATSTRGR